MRTFEKREAGAELIKEWGSSAARKLGALNAWEAATLQRISKTTNGADTSYSDWVRDLGEFEFKQTVRALVAGLK